MRRREFITLLGGAAVTGSSAARAQQATMPVIGYLSGWSLGDAPEYLNYFRQGLAETGYTEGRNVAIEYRYAAGRFGEKPADLPVQVPVKFELFINRRAFQALGLTIPQTLLATADEVIE
jgi:hypothetical protein